MSIQDRFEFKPTPDPTIEDNEYIFKEATDYHVQAHPMGDYYLANHYRTNEHGAIVLRELGLFKTLESAMDRIIKVWENDNAKN